MTLRYFATGLLTLLLSQCRNQRVSRRDCYRLYDHLLSRTGRSTGNAGISDKPIPFWLINAGASQPAQQSPYRCVCGGCLPRCASSSRITKASGRFMCSAMTVARPVGVIPTTRMPSQRKCSRMRLGADQTMRSPLLCAGRP
jgi:hypothetical protein